MTKQELIADINSEFNARGFITNSLTDRMNIGERELVSHYRPLSGRGRDQIRCIIAHYLRWQRHGTTKSYCHECPSFLRMTCMKSSGFSDDCGLGNYRLEAT